MEFLSKLKKNIKYIKLEDLSSLFVFILAYPLSFFLRLWFKAHHKQVWLIAESPDTARDNGYHFFKYMANEHPEVAVYYAIERHSADRDKVVKLGSVINYGSFKHWLYYLAAAENISTQKSGNPAPALFYLLHIYGLIKNNRTFLQHGITYNNQKWLYFNETKFKLIICGAKKEYDYIVKKFGYPRGSVVYTGFSRFDSLYEYEKKPKQILVMPTWRNWLGRETNILDSNKENFTETTYFKHWLSLLNNDSLLKRLEKERIKLYFYPHFNMQRYAHLFKSKSSSIEIVSREDADIQVLLKESSFLVTDYSSIFFDFAYMGKPLAYYQFDEQEFRQKQYEKGYFSYRADGFGPVVEDESRLIDVIISYIDNGFKSDELFTTRAKKFFTLRDDRNSERIYKAIKSLASQKDVNR